MVSYFRLHGRDYLRKVLAPLVNRVAESPDIYEVILFKTDRKGGS